MEVLTLIITLIILFPIIWSYLITIISCFKKNNTLNIQEKRTFYITTIICAHNEEKTIDNILKCITKEHYKYNDTFVILDNCTDKTKQVVEKYSEINIIEKKDASTTKGDALNYGINQLKRKNLLKDIILILDADASISPNFLENISNAYSNGSEAVMVCNKVMNPYDNIITSWYAIYWGMVSSMSRKPHSKLNLSSNLCGCGMSFKKEHLINIKTITEDVEYFFNLSTKNIKIDYLENAITYQEQPTKMKDMINQLRRWTSGIIMNNKLYLKNSIKSLINKFNIMKFDVLITNEICTSFANLIIVLIVMIIIGILKNTNFLIYALILFLIIIIEAIITAYTSIKESNYDIKKMYKSIPTYFIFVGLLGLIYNYSRIKPQKKWINITRKK